MALPRKRIGVLALQGAFERHRLHLQAAGADYVPVSRRSDLEDIDGLILPGGESGAMLRLLAATALEDPLREWVQKKPVWGICAGAILLARCVTNPVQRSFSAIDITIERNGFGRQRESSEDLIDGYPVAFIRAPRILQIGNGLCVNGRRGTDPVWVESERVMVTTFHPEVSPEVPSPWHLRFVKVFPSLRS